MIELVDCGVSPFKLNTHVRFVRGAKNLVGKEGYISEIHKDAAGNRTLTVEFQTNDGIESIHALAEHLQIIKESK